MKTNEYRGSLLFVAVFARVFLGDFWFICLQPLHLTVGVLGLQILAVPCLERCKIRLSDLHGKGSIHWTPSLDPVNEFFQSVFSDLLHNYREENHSESCRQQWCSQAHHFLLCEHVVHALMYMCVLVHWPTQARKGARANVGMAFTIASLVSLLRWDLSLDLELTILARPDG